MGKKKSRKHFSSAAENPFNIKINRTKHSILGQKVKGTRGLPGVSHAAGNAKLKEIFHKKKLQLRKSNKYLDRRLLDSNQTYEDPATARLIHERKKKLKKSIYNLNDNESLTHKGLPLLDNLSNKIDVSDDEEPLDSSFIKQAHFGGFSGNSAPKSRKEIIDELIEESKKRKHEIKVVRETNADLIEKLDQEWKERHAALPLLKKNNNLDLVTKSDKMSLLKVNKNHEVHDKYDPFDVFLRELKYEKRTTPVTCLKTPEEIAKEEYEKQQVLKEERNRRMNPIDTKHDVYNQLSADSIYDGLDIQFETEHNQNNDDQNVKEIPIHDSDDDSAEDEDECEFSAVEEDESASTQKNESVIPDTLEAFINIAGIHDNLNLLVDDIVKAVIKNKTKQNIEKLERFFIILIEYVMKNKAKQTKAFHYLDQILPHLYTLAEISLVNTAQKLLVLLDNELEIFQASKTKKIRKNFPRFQSLVLFKITSTIYSVSDFRHPVVTPAITFMCDILSGSFTCSVQNIISRLCICKNIYDCVSYSRRYVPEVIFFLNKILKLVINENKILDLVSKEISLQEKTEINLGMSNIVFNDGTKVSIIFKVFKLLNQYAQLYSNLLSFMEIFSISLKICDQLPENYPHFLKETISQFTTFVKSVKKSYIPLTYENKKPVPLKLFEPAFDSKFTRKKDDIKKKRKLVKNVQQKIKKEERGMLREMRRENQVVASEKLKEKLEGDEERKRKVKQLYSELAMQEGECKKFLKKK